MLLRQSPLTKTITPLYSIVKKSIFSLTKLHNSSRGVTTPPQASTHVINMDNKEKDNRIVWVDLEMTGLDVVNDHILEIACIITEKDLKLVAEGPNLIIHQTESVLDKMGEWCVKQHGESGLTDASRNSKIDIKQAEKIVLEFVQKHTPKGKCPIGGNSVGTDRQFIQKHMPNLEKHLHYRVIDVSSVKELCRRWYPDVLKSVPLKKISHRAMDDIRESIEELRYYRQAIFK